MKIKALIICILLLPAFSFAEKMDINTEKSVLTWLGKKVSGEHDGVVNFKSGHVDISDGELVGGEFVLDMNSIKNKDIDSDKFKAKLENHLKSDDFFNITEFPEAKFVIKKASPAKLAEETEVKLIGELTVKGITAPVAIPVTITKNESGGYHGKGKVSIDRTLWDIRYNSNKFFDPAKLGEKLIYDEIEIGTEIFIG